MKYWKEKYTIKKAMDCGIHGHEYVPVIGYSDEQWAPYVDRRIHDDWIYYVEVCGFQFAFFSIEMLELYIDFFSRKSLPSTRFGGISLFSRGAAASVGDGQSPFERLPAYLRKKNYRPRVVKALTEAKAHFESNVSHVIR